MNKPLKANAVKEEVAEEDCTKILSVKGGALSVKGGVHAHEASEDKKIKTFFFAM